MFRPLARCVALSVLLAACSDPSIHLIDSGPTIDTPVTCRTDAECGTSACDPETGLCVPFTCIRQADCSDGMVCAHAHDLSIGLCRPACTTVGDAGCAAGQTCVFENGIGFGACVAKGTAPLGAACTVEEVSTGCAEGICRKAAATDTEGTCVASCDPFEATSSCGNDKLCSPAYDCTTDPATVQSAGLQQFCANADTQCALDGGTTAGYCVSFYGVVVCRKSCRTGVPTDCPASTICGQPPPVPDGSHLGVCMPALDNSACVDGGDGTCATCRAAEDATGGCCEGAASACTTQSCRDFIDCAMACKRDKACVDACVAADPVAALLGTPDFLCLSGYGAPSGGACGDACGGLQVCGDYDGPDTASTCQTCNPADASCRADGCYNSFYCDRITMKCTNPLSVPNCAN